MESSQIESKQTSFRDSNMELLRIVCMLLVILCHANYMSLGSPSQSDTIIHSGSSFFRMYLFAVSAICVNCFILISGWYGIRPKLKRFISLMFQVLFVCSVSLLLYSIHSNQLPIVSIYLSWQDCSYSRQSMDGCHQVQTGLTEDTLPSVSYFYIL